MTEVNENYLISNTQAETPFFSESVTEGRRTKGKVGHRTGGQEWCCCNKGTRAPKESSPWLILRDQINVLKGQVKVLTDLVAGLFASKSCPSDTDSPTQPSPDSPTEPSPTNPDPGVEEPEEPGNSFDFLVEGTFNSHVQEYLSVSPGEDIGEERLYHATVAFLLEGLHGEDGLTAYEQVRTLGEEGSTNREENATKEALRELRDNGTLSSADAEKIHSIAFHSAQFDTRGTALGAIENGVAREVEAATVDAFADLEAILNGELEYKERPLS